MPIPLNIQYKQAVCQASNFDKLNPIEPVKEGGDIKAAAGGFAIVFKMYKPDEGKYYALKCFTAPVAHRNERIHAIHQYLSNITSPHFAQFKYLPTELWVNTTPTEGAEYPVVLMEWIEGQTLGEAIQAACQQRNTNRLKQLLIQFIDLAMILLAMPCAHGDLKHDNIIVSNTGHLVLVDYDGMFVPVLQGQEANELGGQDYQHQSRTGSTFDRHIDDFSIAIICLSIGALIHQPALYAQYNHGQNLLLRRRDWQHQALSQCEVLRGLHTPALQPLIQYIEQTANYRLPRLFEYLLDLKERLEKSLVDTPVAPTNKKPTAETAKPTTQPNLAHLPAPIQQLINNMVLVEGGTFMMGSNSEKPIHAVTLDTYYIAKYLITQAQWIAVMGNNPSGFKGDNLPVEKVNWDDIQAFLQKLNQLTAPHYIFSLPTEAQWEYAARGGNRSKGFEYAGSDDCDEVAWHEDNSDEETHPVGQKKPNELGLYDMSGNVYEWCQDWYNSEYYKNSPSRNPVNTTPTTYRMVRGGSWINNSRYCRVSNRLSNNPGNRYDGVGFRVSRRL